MKYAPSFLKLFFCSWTLALSVVFNIVSAQSDTEHVHQSKRYITYRTKVSLFFLGAGVISTGNHEGTLNVTIPYKTMDINGNESVHIFNGSSNRLFSNQSPQLIFGFDISRPLFALNFSAGLNTSYKGAFYSIGSGYNLYLGQNGKTLQEKTKTCNWILRPSLNLKFFSFSSGSLGSIDNTNTTIYILDREAKPTFTYGVLNRNNTRYKTYITEADELVITYKQKQFGLEPKISFCSNPYKNSFNVQIFASYFIPFFESSGILLRQYNTSGNRKNLVSGSSRNNLTHRDEIDVTYNNHALKSVAFNARHIYIGFVIGFTLKG